MSASVANAILDVIRDSLEMHVGVTTVVDEDGAILHRVDARSNSGESWAVQHEDFYKAVVTLAGMVRLNVADG